MIRNWRGEEFQRALMAEKKRRIYRACVVVTRHAKHLISIAGTGVINAAGTLVRSRKGETKKRRYGAFPSKPGDPPHKQTGRLRASVTQEVGDSSGRVGTNVKYGRWLELGTSRMKPRPWLRRALSEKLAEVRAILSAPWNPR